MISELFVINNAASLRKEMLTRKVICTAKSLHTFNNRFVFSSQRSASGWLLPVFVSSTSRHILEPFGVNFEEIDMVAMIVVDAVNVVKYRIPD